MAAQGTVAVCGRHVSSGISTGCTTNSRLAQDGVEVRQTRLEVVERRLALERRDLLAELGLNFGLPGELVDGEAQGLRRRLVAGDDEGGDLQKLSAPPQL